MTVIPAQKLREIVLQILYSLGMAKPEPEALEGLLAKELGLPKQVVKTAYARAQAILDQTTDIDKQISQASKAYDFARIPIVERNILRLGVFELFFDQDIPPKVAIAEAVRLARKFSSPEAAAFVNAILDCLYKQSLGESPDNKQLEESINDLKRAQEVAEEASAQELPPKE